MQDWHKLFKFSKIQDNNGKTIYKVHLKYTGEFIGCGTSPDLVGAHSIAFNYFHNKNNQKKIMEAIFEYNLLEET